MESAKDCCETKTHIRSTKYFNITDSLINTGDLVIGAKKSTFTFLLLRIVNYIQTLNTVIESTFYRLFTINVIVFNTIVIHSGIHLGVSEDALPEQQDRPYSSAVVEKMEIFEYG